MKIAEMYTAAAPKTFNPFDRVPPHSVDAEVCLLGSVMLDQTAWVECRAIIDRLDFYQADHQVIWDAICSLYVGGSPVDAVLLRDDLRKRDLLEDVGGAGYIATILGAVPSSAHAAYYAGIVRDMAILRGTIRVGNDILRGAYGPQDDDGAEGVLQRAMTSLANLSGSFRRNEAQRLDMVLAEIRAQMMAGGVATVTTGFRDLDMMTGGVAFGEMCLIGARPSMGKSTIVKQMALRIARSGVPAAIISLEEGKHKIGRNILAAESQVENNKIRKSKFLDEYDWQQIDTGIARLAEVPLYILDGVRRLADIRAEASLLASRHGVQALVIDYLQRVNAGGRDAYERAGLASLGISDLLKDLNMAGIVPVQLNRGVEHREDKRPNMADLRDSGQIEQDADGIVFLHREDYYHTDDNDYSPSGVAELIIAKWRDGVRGLTVKLKSNLKFQTFDDLPEAPQGCPY